MKTFKLLTIFFFFFSTTHTALSDPDCQPTSCQFSPMVRFPFHLTSLQDSRCGVPGFGLSCNHNNQTILTLPLAGKFIVKRIDYTNKWIYINDPDFCIPKRLQSFNLYRSPFISAFPMNITFLNCSSDSWYDFQSLPIYCLSTNPNYTVVVSGSSYVPPGCRNMSRVSAPVKYSAYRYRNPGDLRDDLMLTWRIPACMACEAKGGTCGYKDVNRGQIGCFNLPGKGMPRTIKYGITIGLGIPGLVCLLGLACYTASKMKTISQIPKTSISLTHNHIANRHITTGLDGPTIESYPKIVLGKSGRLPKPSDGTCSICLAEYQPKETLRAIPECNHYFHANCIDEWLRMNATCPLCRKSPDGSSVVTPSSSMLLSLSSSSSSSIT
ncbi:putative RING-H2 finger protein ATL21A [Camellia lanceoleosa]|uniref:RING-H2 finger protein ATL21A n=1 Tax=Camellia lanceoleosa TaxID=1840588 RepID=A0ACC0FHK5_9ERIC|nr:putative RING-H2 finger protein ATL21A [Camellia lanceoleosa]